MRFLPAVLTALTFLAWPTLLPAADKVWNNPAGGAWNTADNWSPVGVPGIGDNVYITNIGSYQVSLDVSSTVKSLIVGGASGTQTLSNAVGNIRFNGSSAIRNNGVLVMAGGSLGGAGDLTISAGGQMRFINAGEKVFSTLRLLNQGTVVLEAGSIAADSIAPLTVVSNAGLWRMESEGAFNYSFGGPQPRFDNSGTLRKSVSTGTSTFNRWGFVNSGTVDVQVGTLAFENFSGTIAGSWTTAAGSQIQFKSGSSVNGLGAGFTGAGLGRFLGGTLTLSGDGAPPGLRLEGGVVLTTPDFQGGSIIDLTLDGATLAGTNTVGGFLGLNNGALSGNLRIEPGAELKLAGTGEKTFSTLRLLNQGTVVLAAGSISADSIAPLTVISNAGLWRMESEGAFNYSFGGPQPRFENSGTFRKSVGTGTLIFNRWQFVNSGTVDVQVGTMAFENFSGTIAGSWTTAAGSQIQFKSGSSVNGPGAGFTGAGLGRFLGGTLTLSGDSAPPGLRLEGGLVLTTPDFQGGSIIDLTLDGATLAGTNTVGGFLGLNNGALSGNLRIEPGAELKLAGTGEKTFSTLRLLNQGTVVLAAGSISADAIAPLTVISNAGLWRMESEGAFNYSFGGPQPRFENSGTFRKSVGTGTLIFNRWQFVNSGTVDVQVGTMAFENFSGTIAGSWTTAAGSQIQFKSGSSVNGAGAGFTGAGLGRFIGGTLTLSGEGAPLGLRLEGGVVLTTPDFQGGSIIDLTLDGATLAGTNTVGGFLGLNNGALSGNLRIEPGAELKLAGIGEKVFSTLRLLNQGTVVLAAGSISADAIAPLTVISNAGLWRMESDGAFNYSFGGPQPRFDNSGTLRKSVSTGTSTFNRWGFVNSGTVEVQVGTLAFENFSGTIAGSWTTAAGSQIQFKSGSSVNGPGAGFTGAGLGRFLGGTLTLSGDGAPPGLRLEGGQVLTTPDFQGGSIIDLTLDGATLAGTNTVGGFLGLNNGALSGNLRIEPGAELKLAGTGEKTFSTLRLLNQGTVVLAAGSITADSIAPLTVISNAGLWRVESEGAFNYSFVGSPGTELEFAL